jgi:hypothetical protein
MLAVLVLVALAATSYAQVPPACAAPVYFSGRLLEVEAMSVVPLT